MNYIHIKNLEKYHPGYKDRDLIWAKIYFSMIHGDADFQLIDNETDKWRFVAMICLELKSKKPLPDDDRFWRLQGFNLDERPMALTLQMLHGFVECVTQDGGVVVETCYTENIKKSNIKKRREERESTQFVKPTIKEVEDYFNNTLNCPAWFEEAYNFVNHFESNGWKVGGRAPMRSWQAACRKWQTNIKDPARRKRIPKRKIPCPDGCGALILDDVNEVSSHKNRCPNFKPASINTVKEAQEAIMSLATKMRMK